MTLILKDIRHRYGAVEAVYGVSLDVGAGEIVCLFGPSGCGKTTLLRLVAGLERLQSGSIELEGAMLSGSGVDVPAEKRPVGLVFQEYVLFPHMNATANVAFGLKGSGRGNRAREELKTVGLQGLEHRYPHQLSGGQQQRVALARALARRPRAMLLDEPFASVDGVLRRRLREELRSLLKDSGAATMLVTHDPEEALAIGDRIAIMKAGRVIEIAAPQSLFERAQTVEGASMFPGAQQLQGRSEGGVVRTAFGDIRGEYEEGPVIVVVMPGGATLSPNEGNAIIVSSRFAGPGWTLELGAPGGNERLRVPSAVPVEAGSPRALSFDPALVKMFRGGA